MFSFMIIIDMEYFFCLRVVAKKYFHVAGKVVVDYNEALSRLLLSIFHLP